MIALLNIYCKSNKNNMTLQSIEMHLQPPLLLLLPNMVDDSKNLVVGSDFLPRSAVSLDTYWTQPKAVRLELVS